MLTTNDLLVTQPRLGADDVDEGRHDPREEPEDAAGRLELQAGAGQRAPRTRSRSSHVSRSFSARISNERNQGRRQIIVIDLETGTTRMTIGLRPSDIAQDGAVIAGDVLLVKIRRPRASGSSAPTT